MTLSTQVPDQVGYLDAAARTDAGRAYKARLAVALDLRPGLDVLDIGCGPGTDLAVLADAVTATGSVVGVDRDPGMVGLARARLAGRANVAVRTGDAHALPLPAGSVDRARTDRVLQHVEDPAVAIAQAARVLRGGGLLGMAEPDWDTLAVADEDVEVSRAFARFVAGRVRNPTVGRQLPRLAAAAGLAVDSVEAFAVVLRDPAVAEQILGLRRNVARAVGAGMLTADAAHAWLARRHAGEFLAGFTVYLVTARS
ncbi:methyltransferase domain-containing protein [Luedemannella flava]